MVLRSAPTVAIVDYGSGNLASLDQAFQSIGARTTLVATPDQLAGADAIVLPGIGHFGPASDRLQRSGLAEALPRWISAGLPILGICLGFQLLTASSEEAPQAAGLGHFPLRTERLAPVDTRLHKVPHLGWNNLECDGAVPHLLSGIPVAQQLFYFANAYAIAPRPEFAGPQALYRHEQTWLGLVEQGSVFGVQFHPEKSRSQGLQLLRNFLAVG